MLQNYPSWYHLMPYSFASCHEGRIQQCCRIRIFFGLPDPDPLVRGTDSAPVSSIIKQKKKKKNFIPTVLWLLYDFFEK
jgi:hypothetical protein